MKNLPKRTKIVLAIVGIVVVIAVVGLVITQTPAGGLLGTTAIVITPSNPTITEGSTLTLTANGVLCGMNSSDKTAVSIVFAQPSSITVKGLKSGTSSTITASCFGGVRASTTVTVGPPLAITVGPDTGKTVPQLGFNEKMTLCANDPHVQWSVEQPNPPDVVSLTGSSYASGCALVTANTLTSTTGNAIIRATNSYGASATVQVVVNKQLTMEPAYPTIAVGDTVVLDMPSFPSNYITYSIVNGCEGAQAQFCPVTLTANSTHSVIVKGVRPGYVFITGAAPDPITGKLGTPGLTVVSVR